MFSHAAPVVAHGRSLWKHTCPGRIAYLHRTPFVHVLVAPRATLRVTLHAATRKWGLDGCEEPQAVCCQLDN